MWCFIENAKNIRNYNWLNWSMSTALIYRRLNSVMSVPHWTSFFDWQRCLISLPGISLTFGRFVVVCCAGLNVCDSVMLFGAGLMPRAFWFREAAGRKVPPGGVWTRWREKGRGVWAGCGEMFGFWRGAATAGVRDGGECGRMRDGKCPFGAMISGGETWKGIFLRGAGCVL